MFHLLAWLAQISWLITQEITLTQADSLKLTCVALGGHLPAPVLSPDSQTSPSASSVSPACLAQADTLQLICVALGGRLSWPVNTFINLKNCITHR